MGRHEPWAQKSVMSPSGLPSIGPEQIGTISSENPWLPTVHATASVRMRNQGRGCVVGWGEFIRLSHAHRFEPTGPRSPGGTAISVFRTGGPAHDRCSYVNKTRQKGLVTKPKQFVTTRQRNDCRCDALQKQRAPIVVLNGGRGKPGISEGSRKPGVEGRPPSRGENLARPGGEPDLRRSEREHGIRTPPLRTGRPALQCRPQDALDGHPLVSTGSWRALRQRMARAVRRPQAPMPGGMRRDVAGRQRLPSRAFPSGGKGWPAERG
jgi:hypothetical protein